MPTEQEMLPKDKYTIFDRKEKKYRKGIHSMFSSLSGCAVDAAAMGMYGVVEFILTHLQSCQNGPDFPRD
jgi:hypothetical protein